MASGQRERKAERENKCETWDHLTESRAARKQTLPRTDRKQMGGTKLSTCPPPVTLWHQDLQSEPSHYRIKKIQSQAVGGALESKCHRIQSELLSQVMKEKSDKQTWRRNFGSDLLTVLTASQKVPLLALLQMKWEKMGREIQFPRSLTNPQQPQTLTEWQAASSEVFFWKNVSQKRFSETYGNSFNDSFPWNKVRWKIMGWKHANSQDVL